jgi:hypothetical protein
LPKNDACVIFFLEGRLMLKVAGLIRHDMPLIFGLGFVAPLPGWALPFGAAPLAVGLVIGGLWGVRAASTAKLRR